jgi:hypothetical protein
MPRKGSKIKISLSGKLGQGEQAGSAGAGDSPWCNVGLTLVILGAVELRWEAMGTVERIFAGIVTYYHCC